MSIRLLIKHAVGGRVFIDSAREEVAFTHEWEADKWRFSIQIPRTAGVEQLLIWKDELNLFVFSQPETGAEVKRWFYVNEGEVSYDEGQQRLTIVAADSITYVPDEF